MCVFYVPPSYFSAFMPPQTWATACTSPRRSSKVRPDSPTTALLAALTSTKRRMVRIHYIRVFMCV